MDHQTRTSINTEALGVPIDTSDVVFATAVDRGTALHLAFRVLINRPELSAQLNMATALGPKVTDAIASQAELLRNKFEADGYDQIHFELPVQDNQPDGSQTNAVIECLAEDPNGFVILDHKSGHGLEPEARFTGYLPQLQSYARLMTQTRPAKPVLGLAIN